jgi:hypothetical protein
MTRDLPRDPGTLYALKLPSGRCRPVEYMEAYTAWKNGRDVYTKNGNGTRAERNAREWEPVDPPA